MGGGSGQRGRAVRSGLSCPDDLWPLWIPFRSLTLQSFLISTMHLTQRLLARQASRVAAAVIIISLIFYVCLGIVELALISFQESLLGLIKTPANSGPFTYPQ